MNLFCFDLNAPVGGDYAPVSRAFAQALQSETDGVIGSAPQPNKVRGNGAHVSGSGVRRWCTVKIHIDRFAIPLVELLQDGDQFHFIIDRVESQSQLWYQVMSIDQIGHA